TFAARLPRDGMYDVRVSYTPGTNRARQVPVTVRHADGETTSKVNQVEPPPIAGQFASVGTFRFTASRDAAVEITNAGTKEYVIADAVQFVPQPGAESNDPVKKKENVTKKSGVQTSSPSRESIAAAKQQIPVVKKQLETLRKQRGQLKKKAPKGATQVLSVAEDKPRDGYLHIRGGVRNRGPLVPRGVLTVTLHDDAPVIPKDQSGRLQLAEWIASEKNPLTARVMANRVWHHLMGEGLVRTPDNFGTMGERPSHPELLDHLALRFVEHGWSVKKLIREVILTRTYQQSSTPSEAAKKLDPENRLLSHAHRRRLDAEAIRDAMLSVSGKLDLTAFGSTMKQGTKSELSYKFASLRRSIYVPSFRNTQLDMLSAFDAANPNVVTGRRVPSTLPTQALLMMNSPAVIEQSRATAERLIADTPMADDAARIKLLYRRTLGRLPLTSELEQLEAYLATQEREEGKPSSVNAWTRVCQTVFACVDFRYVH
ncbi:MAG: DUF1553 domain-containing protein, partial [Pirellulales bacterium]|nr:DUF1553 domain-containing protein [Pirellulales bacterium]